MAAAACATGPISPIGSTRPIIPAGPSLAACDAGFQTVLQAAADATPGEARAVWLSRRLIRWPGMQPEGRFRLLHSARGRIVAAPGQVARGADGALRLRVETAAEPATLQTRFKWLAAGALLALRAADLPRLQQLHRGQLVLVQEGADGRVRQATALQVAGALDDLYASAETVADLGATARATRATRAMHAMRTRFKLWAPTAQSVRLCLHRNGTAPAHALLRW